ncbi:MFS transporter [Microlunatus soli]|uniref:MFS transporter, NNP family, nitrate/nitrite transporter n=1 Tax=Microlunatus soli TaxID=630515 RepID=A0A1H1VBM5_9ACTN|nr:MFS transporter [Microlunatus soli]SDS82165.1 MFS transporter, NNP family, nitrate/nitrite transporter [Microlunatus soli]
MSLTREDAPHASGNQRSSTTTRPSRPRGRWIDDWRPEDATFWEQTGRRIAQRNLGWSIFTEFLGFVVWQLWSIVVVMLPKAGFTLSTAETFWLISLPSLVGATMRFPYTFMVGRFGGRNWTIVSALLLLIPTTGLAVCVGNPQTPFPVLLVIAGFAGFGGGNFASSMANITFFYPAREKGWALGLNAAGGNLGASVAQFVVPIAVSVTAGVGLNLPIAGWLWIPLILLAAFGAWRFMNNLTTARSDFAGSLAAIKEPHLWLMALLYVGTFGSFIGFAGVFPKLIIDTFPAYSSFTVGSAALSLAFLGALVGSLARPYGGRLADRFGGSRITAGAFVAMAVGAVAVVLVLPLANFAIFLSCFLFIFIATGIGNGATYRMIPAIFAARAGRSGDDDHQVSHQRKASAALGLIAAIGAYGGFIIPQILSASKQATGGYTAAFIGFAAGYLVMLIITVAVYVRGTAGLDGVRV